MVSVFSNDFTNKFVGVITSNKRSTVYIVSDFAEYNSSNLKSNFYQNVVINFEDKQIDCDYFDLDMQTNIAIAYNNVVVTDPQSIMITFSFLEGCYLMGTEELMWLMPMS